MFKSEKQSLHCEITPEKQKEIIYTAGLKHGTRAYFYFIDSSCTWCLEQGLTLLSPASRRYRFNFSFKEFTKQDLHYLTHIDNKNHLAIAARHRHGLDAGYPGMGVGRYIRLPEKRNCAEIAITVMDDYQSRGLGTVLFCLLAHYAMENRITYLCGYVQAENTAMLKLFHRFDSPTISRDYGLIYLKTDLKKCRKKIERILREYELPKT
jgi:ribosomal protein S18 acetylase RimI-like enzyme